MHLHDKSLFTHQGTHSLFKTGEVATFEARKSFEEYAHLLSGQGLEEMTKSCLYDL